MNSNKTNTNILMHNDYKQSDTFYKMSPEQIIKTQSKKLRNSLWNSETKKNKSNYEKSNEDDK